MSSPRQSDLPQSYYTDVSGSQYSGLDSDSNAAYPAEHDNKYGFAYGSRVKSPLIPIQDISQSEQMSSYQPSTEDQIESQIESSTIEGYKKSYNVENDFHPSTFEERMTDHKELSHDYGVNDPRSEKQTYRSILDELPSSTYEERDSTNNVMENDVISYENKSILDELPTSTYEDRESLDNFVETNIINYENKSFLDELPTSTYEDKESSNNLIETDIIKYDNNKEGEEIDNTKIEQEFGSSYHIANPLPYQYMSEDTKDPTFNSYLFPTENYSVYIERFTKSIYEDKTNDNEKEISEIYSCEKELEPRPVIEPEPIVELEPPKETKSLIFIQSPSKPTEATISLKSSKDILPENKLQFVDDFTDHSFYSHLGLEKTSEVIPDPVKHSISSGIKIPPKSIKYDYHQSQLMKCTLKTNKYVNSNECGITIFNGSFTYKCGFSNVIEETKSHKSSDDINRITSYKSEIFVIPLKSTLTDINSLSSHKYTVKIPNPSINSTVYHIGSSTKARMSDESYRAEAVGLKKVHILYSSTTYEIGKSEVLESSAVAHNYEEIKGLEYKSSRHYPVVYKTEFIEPSYGRKNYTDGDKPSDSSSLYPVAAPCMSFVIEHSLNRREVTETNNNDQGDSKLIFITQYSDVVLSKIKSFNYTHKPIFFFGESENYFAKELCKSEVKYHNLRSFAYDEGQSEEELPTSHLFFHVRTSTLIKHSLPESEYGYVYEVRDKSNKYQVTQRSYSNKIQFPEHCYRINTSSILQNKEYLVTLRSEYRHNYFNEERYEDKPKETLHESNEYCVAKYSTVSPYYPPVELKVEDGKNTEKSIQSLAYEIPEVYRPPILTLPPVSDDPSENVSDEDSDDTIDLYLTKFSHNLSIPRIKAQKFSLHVTDEDDTEVYNVEYKTERNSNKSLEEGQGRCEVIEPIFVSSEVVEYPVFNKSNVKDVRPIKSKVSFGDIKPKKVHSTLFSTPHKSLENENTIYHSQSRPQSSPPVIHSSCYSIPKESIVEENNLFTPQKVIDKETGHEEEAEGESNVYDIQKKEEEEEEEEEEKIDSKFSTIKSLEPFMETMTQSIDIIVPEEDDCCIGTQTDFVEYIDDVGIYTKRMSQIISAGNTINEKQLEVSYKKLFPEDENEDDNKEEEIKIEPPEISSIEENDIVVLSKAEIISDKRPQILYSSVYLVSTLEEHKIKSPQEYTECSTQTPNLDDSIHYDVSKLENSFIEDNDSIKPTEVITRDSRESSIVIETKYIEKPKEEVKLEETHYDDTIIKSDSPVPLKDNEDMLINSNNTTPTEVISPLLGPTHTLNPIKKFSQTAPVYNQDEFSNEIDFNQKSEKSLNLPKRQLLGVIENCDKIKARIQTDLIKMLQTTDIYNKFLIALYSFAADYQLTVCHTKNIQEFFVSNHLAWHRDYKLFFKKYCIRGPFKHFNAKPLLDLLPTVSDPLPRYSETLLNLISSTAHKQRHDLIKQLRVKRIKSPAYFKLFSQLGITDFELLNYIYQRMTIMTKTYLDSSVFELFFFNYDIFSAKFRKSPKRKLRYLLSSIQSQLRYDDPYLFYQYLNITNDDEVPVQRLIQIFNAFGYHITSQELTDMFYPSAGFTFEFYKSLYVPDKLSAALLDPTPIM